MRLARSTGMANPIPEAPPTIAVLIPMSCPSTLTSGPPELPGLIEASVWMKSVKTRSRFSSGTVRPTRGDDAGGDGIRQAERVPDRDHRLADQEVRGSAQRIVGRSPLDPRIRRTARSLSWSAPTTSHSYSWPPLVVAMIFDAPETTWSLVRIMPLALMTVPEPRDFVLYRRGAASTSPKN